MRRKPIAAHRLGGCANKVMLQVSDVLDERNKLFSSFSNVTSLEQLAGITREDTQRKDRAMLSKNTCARSSYAQGAKDITSASSKYSTKTSTDMDKALAVTVYDDMDSIQSDEGKKRGKKAALRSYDGLGKGLDLGLQREACSNPYKVKRNSMYCVAQNKYIYKGLLLNCDAEKHSLNEFVTSLAHLKHNVEPNYSTCRSSVHLR